ncbi:MAG: UrcA family protein [Pseudomonadota bacterium]
MIKTLTFIGLAAACGVLALNTTAEATVAVDDTDFVFEYSGADLASADDLDALYKRLNREAKRFCRAGAYGHRSTLRAERDCQDDIVDAVATELGRRFMTGRTLRAV